MRKNVGKLSALVFLGLLVLPLEALAQTQTAAMTGYCTAGGTKAAVSGIKSTNYQQGVIPSCTVTVFFTNTTTQVPGNQVFANVGGTVLGNPFTANAANSLTPGQWTFFVAVNQGYDVVGSGGIAPNTYPSPVPLVTGGYPGFQFTAPGGAGNPALPFGSQQFNNSGVFGGSAAQLNAAGDAIDRSLNGFAMPQLYQTSPGSNDGIANILATTNATALVTAGYGNEVQVGPCNGGSIWRTPFLCGGFGTPPAYANNTFFTDYRPNSIGNVWYNYNFSSTPTQITPSQYDIELDNDVAQASGSGPNLFQHQVDWFHFCCGKDEDATVGQWSTTTMLNYTQFENVQGIASGLTFTLDKQGEGDGHVFQCLLNGSGGHETPNDEGYACYRNQMNQPPTPPTFISNILYTQGATVLLASNGTQITNNMAGERTNFVISSQATQVYHVIATTPQMEGLTPPVAATVTVQETLSGFDTIGRTNCGEIDTPQQFKGATTNMTCALTNLTAPITTGWIFLGDPQNNENAAVVSVGSASGTSPNITQTIVMALRLEHANQGYISQGPHAGWGLETVANEFGGTHCANNNANAPCPIRTMMWVIGIPSAHTILYSRLQQSSGWVGITNGVFSSVANFAATGISRTSNVTTIPLPVIGGLSMNQATVQVSGCTDPSFNGTFSPSTTTTTTMSWPNTGSNGTTTCTNPIYLMRPDKPTLPFDGIQLMPMATVVQSENPTTHAPDLSIVISANPYTIHIGDQYEGQPGPIIASMYKDAYDIITPGTSSANQSFHFIGLTGPLPDGFELFQVQFFSSFLPYLTGGGGVGGGGRMIDIQGDPGIFSGWISANAPGQGTMFSIGGCGAYSCTDPNYTGYQIFNAFGAPSSGWSEAYLPSLNRLQTIVSSPTRNTIFNDSAAGVSFDVTGNNMNGTVNLGYAETAFGVVIPSAAYTVVMNNTTGTQFQDIDQFLGPTMKRTITNISTGATTTFTHTSTGYTLTGSVASPTALDAGSTVGGNLIITSTTLQSGAGTPSGSCSNGTIYTSSTGTTTNNLWVCGSGAWQLVH